MLVYINKTVGFGTDHNNCQRSAMEILLILDPLVECNKNIKFAFCEIEKRTVFLAGKARFRHRLAIVRLETYF